MLMLVSLGQPIANTFDLLFVEEMTPDFAEMLLHHICHFGLIFACIVGNFSDVGAAILFCHSASDVFL